MAEAPKNVHLLDTSLISQYYTQHQLIGNPSAQEEASLHDIINGVRNLTFMNLYAAGYVGLCLQAKGYEVVLLKGIKDNFADKFCPKSEQAAANPSGKPPSVYHLTAPINQALSGDFVNSQRLKNSLATCYRDVQAHCEEQKSLQTPSALHDDESLQRACHDLVVDLQNCEDTKARVSCFLNSAYYKGLLEHKQLCTQNDLLNAFSDTVKRDFFDNDPQKMLDDFNSYWDASLRRFYQGLANNKELPIDLGHNPEYTLFIADLARVMTPLSSQVQYRVRNLAVPPAITAALQPYRSALGYASINLSREEGQDLISFMDEWLVTLSKEAQESPAALTNTAKRCVEQFAIVIGMALYCPPDMLPKEANNHIEDESGSTANIRLNVRPKDGVKKESRSVTIPGVNISLPAVSGEHHGDRVLIEDINMSITFVNAHTMLST